MLWSKIVSLDEKITSSLRLKESAQKIKPFAVFFAHSGDSWFILLVLFIVWLATRGGWHHTMAVMAAGTITLAVLVLIIKFSIRRKRPEGEWGAIYRKSDPHSFPSGHAARAAMLAVLAMSFGPLWFGLAVAIWAPLVSLARVAMGVHYFSDVLAGIVLGILAGFGFFTLAPIVSAWLPFLFYKI
jgi:membrane-associated phospholipid phosphatase